MTHRLPLRLVVYVANYVGRDIDADMAQIEQASHRHNPSGQITGALLFDRGQFVQVIEGPHDAISLLLDRLQRDPRISEWQTLLDQDTDHRSCESWAMGILRTDNGERVPVAILDAFRDKYLRTFKADASGFIELFTAIMQ